MSKTRFVKDAAADSVACAKCSEIHDPLKCRAHAKATKKQCKRPPLPGQRVCFKHGANGRSKALAERRILAAADPIAAKLIEIALNGASEAVQVSAARDLLDRAGLASKQKVEVSGGAGFVIEYLVPGADSVSPAPGSPSNS